jgi:hypothetical protein
MCDVAHLVAVQAPANATCSRCSHWRWGQRRCAPNAKLLEISGPHTNNNFPSLTRPPHENIVPGTETRLRPVQRQRDVPLPASASNGRTKTRTCQKHWLPVELDGGIRCQCEHPARTQPRRPRSQHWHFEWSPHCPRTNRSAVSRTLSHKCGSGKPRVSSSYK